MGGRDHVPTGEQEWRETGNRRMSEAQELWQTFTSSHCDWRRSEDERDWEWRGWKEREREKLCRQMEHLMRKRSCLFQGALHPISKINTRSKLYVHFNSVQSVAQSCPTLWDAMNRTRQASLSITNSWSPRKPHVHWVGDAIQQSHPPLSPSSPALNLSQHQGLFQWVNSSHQVAEVVEFQLQHQSFQWMPRTDLL